MRMLLMIAVALLAWMPAFAAETAVTVREVELKKTPFADAETIATLPAQTSVEILLRQGGWTQIKSPSNQGWVKMMSLRLGNGAPQQQGDSGLASLLNIGRTGSSGVTVATGVKGLSEEDIRNAAPNPQELEKMQSFAASVQEARKFADAGKLKTAAIDYLGIPAAKAAPEKSGAGWGGQP